jgi:hypothetical protein
MIQTRMNQMSNEIKLLKIHKRRVALLKEQLAKTGAQHNVTVTMEIQDAQEQMTELEEQLKRRLHGLRMKMATYGNNADPSVSMEIEDIEGYFSS